MSKQLKNKMKLHICYVVFGFCCLMVSALAPIGDYQKGIFGGIGTVLLVVGLVSLFRYWRLAHDPERAEEWLAMQNEERTAFIATKARVWTFYIFIFVELAMGLIALFAMDNKLLGEVLCYLVAAQGLCSVILYYVFNRKY